MTDPHIPFMGFGESLFLSKAGETPQPWLATGFEVASDLSGVTITIREGVQFHTNNGDFGNVTAEDVAWSMNNANLATNPGSIHGSGSIFSTLWGEWEAIDSITIKFDFATYDARWAEEFLNQTGALFTVYSRRAFDEKGEAWVRDHVVTTGPYEVEEWMDGERLTLFSHYAGGGQHYIPALTPETDRVVVMQMPEDVVRAAVLRNGIVDAAILRPNDAQHFINSGFALTPASSGPDLVFNPKKILSWEMGRTGVSEIGDTWNLVLQP